MSNRQVDLPSYPPVLLFPPAYLDHRRQPEPVISELGPSAPSYAPPAKVKESRPLAASPTPARFYSQYKCPICNCTIAEAHGADYVGHTPCLHRGPCPNPKCIKAYYGRSSGGRPWAIPYEGSQPLYCQAAGCGRRIDGWTLVKAVMAPSRTAVMPVVVTDPELEKKMELARKRRYEVAMTEEQRRQREERRKKESEWGKFKRGCKKASRGTLQGCILTSCCFCMILCGGAMD
ncbi:hypothetical protein VTJ04DRAFT_4194 [Mycothermus thermophilus]|uniref:uncharacterized protein n=1 Tax=Humicola insolens TaxID=85995 RepID=UPI0037425CA1